MLSRRIHVVESSPAVGVVGIPERKMVVAVDLLKFEHDGRRQPQLLGQRSKDWRKPAH